MSPLAIARALSLDGNDKEPERMFKARGPPLYRA